MVIETDSVSTNNKSGESDLFPVIVTGAILVFAAVGIASLLKKPKIESEEDRLLRSLMSELRNDTYYSGGVR
jgi:hypothetical protein